MLNYYQSHPLVRRLLLGGANLFLSVTGWRLGSPLPDGQRYVFIVYPPERKLPLFAALMLASRHGLRLHWLGHHRLFRFPFGWFARWIGGIPMNRLEPATGTEAAVRLLQLQNCGLAVAPAPAAIDVSRWRTGFYWIAYSAGVPIVPVVIDERQKQVRFGSPLRPCGDVKSDLHRLQRFYRQPH